MRLAAACLAFIGGWSLVHAYGFEQVDSGTTSPPTNSSTKESGEDRIFGGTVANIKRNMYIANLRWDGTRAVCGGALVASQFIMTAAHCVNESKPLFASIGSEYASGDGDGEHFAVTDAYVHPKYRIDSHDWDLALLKMNGTSKITPVKLGKADGSDEASGLIAMVRGWGVTENGTPSNVLKELGVRILNDTKCKEEFPDRITENMFCAGDKTMEDSCQGDSGGPLISNDRLIGVVSWGALECGQSAGVYSRISKMHDFIYGIIGGGDDEQVRTTAPAASANTPVPAAKPRSAEEGNGQTAQLTAASTL